ncbi:MAG: efflux RND transporter periplasmic adaptor subunit [Patescibacteria group bacterium]|jgi:HlyD family secretion protein
MKKRNKIIIIVAVVAVILGGWLYARAKGSAAPEYVTAKVERGKLTQTVSATGSVKSTETINLNFAASGRITAVKVKVGDKVRAGQYLAALDSGDLAVQLRQYQAALASAQANLDKILAGASQEEIGVSQAQVDGALAAWNAAVLDLANAENNRDANMKIYRETALTDLQNYLFKARSSMDVVERTYTDPAGKDYLGIKNPQNLTSAKAERLNTLALLNNSEVKINLAAGSGSDADLISGIDSLLLGINSATTTLDYMFSALQDALTTNTFPEASLDALKVNVKAEQTIMNTATGALQTDRSNLQTKKIYYDNAVDTAASAAEIKKQAWTLAQAQYNVTVASPKTNDVSYYRALVSQAAAQVAGIQQKMSDRVISAPTGGTITKVNNFVGETSSLGTPVLVMLPDNPYYIEVDISEADIAKVKVGDLASFTLDAYGSDTKFSGAVLSVEPAETVISGVVYYKVKINLESAGQEIKPGMTANIDIITAEKADVLYLPARAVKTENGKKVVSVLTDSAKKTLETKEVTVGLKGDNGLIELVSGLNEGDEVVVYTKNGK